MLDALSENSSFELSSLDWLLIHHRAKEKERRRMVEDLPLEPGDIVLDLGCGPGLWTSLLAERVSPGGQVIGLDASPELLEYAERCRKDDPHGNLISFREGDFYSIPYPREYFDLVFFSNCFVYARDPIVLLQEQKRVVRKGGVIVGKHFDNTFIWFHPVDTLLAFRVMAAAERALRERPSSRFFDNSFGQKMHGVFLRTGFREVRTITYAIQKIAPLTSEARDYVESTANWYGDTGAPYLSRRDLSAWKSHFDPSSSNYIVERDDFYLCMLEMQTMGTSS